MAETRQLDLVLNLQDKASTQLTGLKGKLDKLQPAFKKMAQVGTASFLAIGAGIGKAVMEASRFDTAMSNVATLLDTNVENMDDMKKEVLALSKALPVPLEELSASLYDIRSAGIEASEAMGVLEASAKLSSAGLSTAQESTDILTSAINSFKKEGLSANEISDMLFKTVKAGKTTISQLAITFGASAPVIADAGVKLADFQSATASLTTTGLPASQAQMGLRQAIVALIKPTGDMEKIFGGLGMTGRELIADSDNMGEAFKRIREEAKKQGVSFEKAIGSVEALNAVVGITDTTSEAYIDTLKGMTDGTNEIEEAYKKQSETFASKTQVVKNQINALVITLGTQFIPMIEQVIEKISPVIEKIAGWIEENPELARNIIIATMAISGLIAVLGILGLILAPVITAVGLIFSPIGIAILAIVALVALLALAWNKDFGGIQEKTKAVFESIKGFYEEYIKPLFETLKAKSDEALEKWRENWDNIKWIFEGVWTAIVGIFEIAWSLISGIVKIAIDLVNGDFTKAIEDFGEMFKGVFNGIKDFFVGIAESIMGIFAIMINKIIENLNKMISKVNNLPGVDIGEVGSISLGKLPSLATGTNYVPQDTMAYLHKGEAVVPKKYNNGGAGGGITVNINGGTYLDRNAGEQLAELMAQSLRTKLRI